MTTGELIEKLKKYPDHFEVEVFLDGLGENDDLTSEILDVQNFQPQKIVSIELATRLLSDGTGKIKRKHWSERNPRDVVRINRPQNSSKA
jgi:hypothetical protein